MKSLVPRWSDALIAVSLYLVAAFGAVASSDTSGHETKVDATAHIVVVLLTMPLAWRQRFPRIVLWITILAWIVGVGLGYDTTTTVWGPIVAMYTVALYVPRRAAWINATVAVASMSAWVAIGIAQGYPASWWYIPQLILAYAVPFAIGLVDSRRNARLVELELDAQRRAQAARLAASDAVRAERARIARELHDVVAHEITVMTLHAEGARRKTPDPTSAEAFSVIADAGRKGLSEMQRVIGVLRASEQELRDEANELRGRPAAETDADEDLAPTPRLDALEKLVAQVNSAGLPTTLTVEGSHSIPAIVEVSAYRIVQEALTNSMKYAGTRAKATVTVTRAKGALTVLVEDDGKGAIMEAAQSSGGHGIAGMQERVTALGGTLEWGPRIGGGFRIQATLPYQGA